MTDVTAQICGYRDMAFYMIFSILFSKTYRKKTNLNFLTFSRTIDKVLLGAANLVSKYDCSNPYGYRDMALLMIFSMFFLEKLYVR